MTAGRAALVGLLDRYLLGLLDPFVTLLEAHKLMYFMQAAGEPLELRFSKGQEEAVLAAADRARFRSAVAKGLVRVSWNGPRHNRGLPAAEHGGGG